MAQRSALAVAVLTVLCIGQVAGSCRKSGPVAPGEAVVFDIDGTLSNDPVDLIFVRDGAVAAVEAYLDLGYQVILLTSRTESLRSVTEAWLELYDFPNVPLYMSDSTLPLLFDWQRVAFKRDTLLQLESDEDLDFVYGYGDSSSDFDAYAEAGIPETEVFALEGFFSHDCEPGDWAECLPDYVDHIMDYVWNQPTAQ